MSKIQVAKVRNFEGHRSAIYTLGKSRRPGHFLSAGSEGILVEWNIESGDGLALAKADAAIYSLASLPEYKLLILGLSTGVIAFVDSTQNKIIKTVQAHKKGVFDFQVFPDRPHALASGEDGSLTVWDLEKLELLHKQQISSKSIRTMAFHPHKEEILLGASDNHIRVLDYGLGEQNKWEAHRFSVFRLDFSLSNGDLLSVGRDAHLAAWQTEKNYHNRVHIPAHLYAINDICQHPEGKLLFTGSMDKSIKVWDSASYKLLKVVDFQRDQCHINGINRLLWVGDSLFSCGDDRLIMQWRLKT